jgi:hypothetical protein
MRPYAALAGLAAMMAAAFSLSACYGPRPHPHHGRADNRAPESVAATLVCPPSFGALIRTAQAADGQSCDYRGPDREQVSLTRLVLAGQSPQAALAPTEAALSGLIAVRPDRPEVVGEGRDEDHARVDLPGVHVHADGDKAEVNVFGVTVNADNDKADVHVGGGGHSATIHANADSAEVHVDAVDGPNVNLVFILAGDHPGPSGYAAVGYLARGLASGPLAVASFKSSDAHHADWRSDHDLNGLLALNVKQ